MKTKFMLPEREPRREGALHLPAGKLRELIETCLEVGDPLKFYPGYGPLIDEDKLGAADWRDLMTILELHECDASVVLEVLETTNWRNASDRGLRSYVRTAATRSIERIFGEKPNIRFVQASSRTVEDGVDPDLFPRTSYRPERKSGDILQDGAGCSTSSKTQIRHGAERWGIFDERAIPFRLLRRDSDGRLVPNWSAIGPEMTAAGVEGTELSVLIMRLQGMTRDEILSLAKSPEERKAFQSAYRSLSVAKKSKIELEIFRPRNGTAPPRRDTCSTPLVANEERTWHTSKAQPGHQQRFGDPIRPPLKAKNT